MRFRDLLKTVRGLRVSYNRGAGRVYAVNFEKSFCMVKVDAGCSYIVKLNGADLEFVSDGSDITRMNIIDLNPLT